jgi:3-mercaptopyruvate sulfurtransferase SseA
VVVVMVYCGSGDESVVMVVVMVVVMRVWW